jgi:hypothetical protein
MAVGLIAIALSVAAGEETKILFEQSFSSGDLSAWEFADESAWKVDSDSTGKFLSSFKDSDYNPPVRSPQNIAWLRDLQVSSFVLDATVRSTQEEYGHRDVCFLFNREDASHFYYVHLATKADEHANSIFLVNGEPRVSIARERTDGTQWTQGWHHVRIVRDAGTGEIQVFFEDMETPVMETVDKTFAGGAIGFGSFDDTADLLEIVIREK